VCRTVLPALALQTHLQKHLRREAYEVELPIDIQVLQRDLLTLTRAVHLVQHLYEYHTLLYTQRCHKEDETWARMLT
jgi:predicted HTH domain antitoxin